MFTPGAIRLLGETAVEGQLARAVGRGVMSRALASASLEAAETALWTFSTAAPGTPLAERFHTAAKFAPLGAATGFGTSLLSSAH